VLNSVSTRLGARITVTAAARLHLGFLDLSGATGRRFGSIGLAISGFKTQVSVAPAEQMRISGPESDHVLAYVNAMRRVLDFGHAYDVRVDQLVPRHAGLGSGTQLALAIAAAMRRLHELPLDLRGDAMRLGRGARSGAGIGLFQRGGLVVDGGRESAGAPAPIISHLPFPDRWRVLVVLDTRRQGAHGTDEAAAFAGLPPAPEADAEHLCRLLVMKLLPAIAELDLAAFGSALEEMQSRLGDYFAPAQGGHRFVSADVAAALGLLQRAGAVGIGQSSWGPTGYAFAPSPETANQILDEARRHPGSRGVDIHICRGLNSGADITVHAPADAPES
jgi:beta-ribofuranosylaminobenzene 5'-phosphate synthase